MSKQAFKKKIKFFSSYYETCIEKGCREEVKRIERRYDNHRANSDAIKAVKNG